LKEHKNLRPKKKNNKKKAKMESPKDLPLSFTFQEKILLIPWKKNFKSFSLSHSLRS